MSHHDEKEDYIPLFKSPLINDGRHGSASSNQSHDDLEASKTNESTVMKVNSDSLHDNPHFHRHAEATNAELFYDLFFVANLTVFTAVHEVNDTKTLAQYVGFFCILWFTWYQVSLYDVRFSMDSVFERVAKACQFGVMIGFAITGPNFDVGSGPKDETDDAGYTAFRTLSLILMVSRLVLIAQYLHTMWFTKHYKNTLLPMGAIAATYLVSAMIYLGLFFTFKLEEVGKNHNYVTWYVVAILETAIATTVSSIWRIVSFKGTHLVQRMSLLTLIILGEGVMGLAKTCQAIVKSQGVFEFEASTIGNIVCAVLILYFLYMIYFDWMSEQHFGTIRQQIWAFLHFPLHLFLVLGVEGIAQSIKWRAANVVSNSFIAEWTAFTIPDEPSESYFSDLASQLNGTAYDYLYAALGTATSLDTTLEVFETMEFVDTAVEHIGEGATEGTDATYDAVLVVYNALINTIYGIAGFETPKDTSEESDDSSNLSVEQLYEKLSEQTDKIGGVFGLTFIYFFVSIGLVVILMTLIAMLSKRQKTRAHWLRLSVSLFVGVALCLLALVSLAANTGSNAFVNYASSPWILPTVLIALFIVVVLNGIKAPSVLNVRARR